GQRQAAIAERRVTQAVPEWPERLSFEVPVRAALHRIILEVGQLIDVFVERHGQTSRRIALATQRSGNGCSTLLAGIPRLEDGVGVRLLPGRCRSSARPPGASRRWLPRATAPPRGPGS